jgi:hypothetical protein
MSTILLLTLLLCRLAGAELTPEQVLAEVRALESHRSVRLARAPRIPDSAYLSAAQGKVVKAVIAQEGAESGKAWGVYVSPVSVQPLWKAINDEPHLVGYIPVTESVVVKGTVRGSGALVFQYLAIPVPGVSDRWWLTRVRFNPALYKACEQRCWELSWMDDAQAFDMTGTPWASKTEGAVLVPRSQGAWLLIPLSDGRTVMEYYVWSNPGGNVPGWVANRLGGGAIEETTRGMERMAREHIPTCSGTYYFPDGSQMP